MVSLRRRKNLGLCPGIPSWLGKISFPVELPKLDDNGNSARSPDQNIKTDRMCPVSSFSLVEQNPEHTTEECAGSSDISGVITSKEEPYHHFPGKQIKNRKGRRRKHKEPEHYPMRGVYFKNTKWRAAIKVDQKQIHLGTVDTQEEAARLYDRAAFVRQRPTNFELSEEEKEELNQYEWDEFLAVARSGISHKEPPRKQKKPGTSLRRYKRKRVYS